jgi:hypothetical protein
MTKMRRLFFIAIAILSFAGCRQDEKHQKHQPDEGGIVLTVDWSKTEAVAPTEYHVRVSFPSGVSQEFANLKGRVNTLPVDPGELVLYVYNKPEGAGIFRNKVIISGAGSGISAHPGMFFLWSGKVNAQRDHSISQTAEMIQQMGELRITLSIKPAAMVGSVRTITGTLEGVASELDIQSGLLSGVSSARIPFALSGFYATTSMRLLGVAGSAGQKLKLDVALSNGNTVSVIGELSSLVAEFNESKNTPLLLAADLNLTGKGVTVDHWRQKAENSYLSVSPSGDIDMYHTPFSQSIAITTDQPSWDYSVTQTGWLTVNRTIAGLDISADENAGDDPREATITVTAGDLSEILTITQGIDGFFRDREVVKLQSAATAKGANIVLMGDGYTEEDMPKGVGKYERDMRAAVEHFFSVYPFSRYRDHFNVYMVVAISNEAGISNKSTGKNVDTKFKTLWEGGNSTGIGCDDGMVFEYLDEISELLSVNAHEISVILPINANIYAGTCWMYYPSGTSNFGFGASICLCPVGRSFREIVVHEASGHGFAKLMDEYVYYRNETIPNSMKNSINSGKRNYGWYENVDFFADITLTSWSGFAGFPKYNMVGAFEGAYMYGKGIWRPEHNSCMNDNTLYFNAPSRWAQVWRIKKLAGLSYSFEQFFQDDEIPQYPARISGKEAEKELPPLAPPVVRDKLPERRR